MLTTPGDTGIKTETTSEQLLAKVEKAIGEIFESLSMNKEKVSVADLIRLLQLKKELEGDRPKEITVRWVTPTED